MADEEDNIVNKAYAPGAPFDADDYIKVAPQPPVKIFYLTCDWLHQMGDGVPRKWEELQDIDLLKAFAHAYENYTQKFVFESGVNILTGMTKPRKVPLTMQEYYSIWLEMNKEQYRQHHPEDRTL
jgi:hypothetical protein